MKYYKILIIAALPVEMKAIQSICKKLNISGITFRFLLCRVGNYNAIFETQKYLQQHQDIDFILNIGVCGKKQDVISDDVFQVYRIKNFASEKESLCPAYINTGNLQSIGSSEKVVTAYQNMGEEQYVDMESYGIDYISKKMKIPHIIMKFPFDTVSAESRKVDIACIEKILYSYDYKHLFTLIHQWCQKNVHLQPDWEVYKKQFGFTVSQMHIFQKQYRKLQAFGVEPIAFIDTHKNLDKKAFLQKITQVQDER